MRPVVLSPGDSQINIRPAHLDDRDAMVAVYASVYGSLYPYMPTPESLCPGDDGYFLVMEIDGKVIGGCGGFERRARGYEWIEWARLAVHRDHWGEGHGKRLNDARLILLQGRDVRSPAMSETVCNNTRNQRILAGLGFRAMGIQPAMYPAVLRDTLHDQPETLLINVCWASGHEFGDFGARRIFVPDHWHDGLMHLVDSACLQQALRAHDGVIQDAPIRHDGPHVDKTINVVGSAFVDIPLNHLDALGQIAQFERQGYRFCGLLTGVYDPSVGSLDRARLYKASQVIDWNLIHVEPQTEGFRRWMMDHAL